VTPEGTNFGVFSASAKECRLLCSITLTTRARRRRLLLILSVVADLSAFDWEGDRPIHRLFLCEMHVSGLTRHLSSGLVGAHQGRYLGVIDKIPYLRDLGVTAVEIFTARFGRK
jgi:pullulanase/glycogen debranching enzyme